MGLFSAGGCTLCGERVKLWDKAASIGAGALRCGSCRSKVKVALNKLASEFRSISSSGSIKPLDWQKLWKSTEPLNLSIEECRAYIHSDLVKFLESLIVTAHADGMATDKDEKHFEQMITMLGVSPKSDQALREKWTQEEKVAQIRRGVLPRVKTDIHLEAGEICHLDCPATYEKENTKSITLISGRLIVTNRKIHFLAHGSGGWTIPYNSILRVTPSKFLIKGTLTFELSKKQGAGSYMVDDPNYAHLIITTLTKISRREIVAGGAGDTTSRRIPQHVKIAVFQRDGGKCVQCGDANYLEFDHIIPFSKGGASTEGNVQLLCRRCNGEKGNQI